MTELSQQDKNFLALILRSPNIGDGWRQVSKTLWPLVDMFGRQELIEINKDELRIRLSETGKIVIDYI